MNFLSKATFLFRRYGSYCRMKSLLNEVKKPTRSTFASLARGLHSSSDETHSFLNETQTDFSQYEESFLQHSVRNLLYPSLTDSVISKLYNCKSIEEIFAVVRDNGNELKPEHLTQCVLVLWDLQKAFFRAYQISVSEFHLSQITSHEDFATLLNLLEEHVEKYDMEELSCTLLYLSKMGVSLQHGLIQKIVARMQDSMNLDITLSSLSRFIVAVANNSFKSVFVTKDALPIVIDKLERCNDVDDFKLITICLNHLHGLVTNEVLEMFKAKLDIFLKEGVLNESNYRTSLKILTFLSQAQWIEENTVLTSKIVKLLQNNFHELGVFDLFIPYEVIYKNQEPGIVLNDLQTRARQLLAELNEESDVALEIKLKLLTCMTAFTAPSKRSDYEGIVSRSLTEPLTKYSLFELLRLLTYTKSTNTKVCDSFWTKVVQLLANEKHNQDLLVQLCHKYTNFFSDTHYRSKEFEEAALNRLTEEVQTGTAHLIPAKLAIMTSFILSFATDKTLIDTITNKINDNYQQFTHLDCLFIAKGLQNIELSKNDSIGKTRAGKVSQALEKSITAQLTFAGDSSKVNYFLKTCIYKKQNYNPELVNDLLQFVNSDPIVTSHSIKNVVFNLKSTNALLPDVLDNISRYVINYKDNLLCFNAEKILNLCYHFGYTPRNSDEMFSAVSDVITRDHDRISGLSYIQAALSLCYFKKLPESFIKRIFNVDFLDELDEELASCYFKDVYPIRVRDNLMQLNRAVCLDYPQANVPWFHQKYVDKFKAKMSKANSEMATNVYSCLFHLVKDSDKILQDVNTPFGYNVNFVIQLDQNEGFVKPKLNEEGEKLAILLMGQNAYSQINVQLKGEHQLKKRHLEKLGYKVLIISSTDWNTLSYSLEKVKHLSNLICPNQTSNLNKSYSVI